MNASDQKTHSQWLITFDGKENPLTATINGKPAPYASATTFSGKRIDDYTFEMTARFNGKVVEVARNVFSKDGKTGTETRTGKKAQGRDYKDVIFFEKQ